MVDLSKLKTIKVISDGTPEGTKLTTNNGDIIGTVTGLQYILNGDKPAGLLRLEVALPALELDIPVDNVSIEIDSVRRCPECGEELEPDITHRPTGEKYEDGEDKLEAVVAYECKPCKFKRVYPFTFDWESVPPDLSEYNDGNYKEEEKTEE